jgi:hypothetical protein
MAHSYAELRGMSLEKLKQKYDHEAKNAQASLNFYRDEITRRQVAEQSERMLTKTEEMRSKTADIRKWTQVVMRLTIVMAALTAVNIVFSLN